MQKSNKNNCIYEKSYCLWKKLLQKKRQTMKKTIVFINK